MCVCVCVCIYIYIYTHTHTWSFMYRALYKVNGIKEDHVDQEVDLKKMYISINLVANPIQTNLNKLKTGSISL